MHQQMRYYVETLGYSQSIRSEDTEIIYKGHIVGDKLRLQPVDPI